MRPRLTFRFLRNSDLFLHCHASARSCRKFASKAKKKEVTPSPAAAANLKNGSLRINQKTVSIEDEFPAVVIGPGSERAPIHEFYEESKLLFGDLVVGKRNRDDYIRQFEKKLNNANTQFVVQQKHEYDVTNYLLFGPKLRKLPEEFRPVTGAGPKRMDFERIKYEDGISEPSVPVDHLDNQWHHPNEQPVVPLKPKKDPVKNYTAVSSKEGNAKTNSTRSSTSVEKVRKVLPLSESSSQSIKPPISEQEFVKVPMHTSTPPSVSMSKRPESLSNDQQPPSSSKAPAVILIKSEGDLRALGRAPLLNPSRPDFVEDPNSVVPPMNLVFKICPEELTTLQLSAQSYPSVSTVLNATMSPENRMRLEAWKQKMINQLGLEGFEKYQQALFADGKTFHTAVETVLRGTDVNKVEVPDRNALQWKSVKNVFREISDVICVEEKVAHPYLCYQGITDGILVLDGKLCLVDWKTSGSRKDSAESLYDNPVQIAAYMGAVNFDDKFAARRLQINEGVIVVAYNSGEPASVIRFNLNLMRPYWIQWLKRLQQYWKMASMDKALPKRST